MEGSPSGLWRLAGNQVGHYVPREFESPALCLEDSPSGLWHLLRKQEGESPVRSNRTSSALGEVA